MHEQRWQDLTEALPQLVWSAMPDGSCDYFSPQWTEHTGVPTHEAGPGTAGNWRRRRTRSSDVPLITQRSRTACDDTQSHTAAGRDRR